MNIADPLGIVSLVVGMITIVRFILDYYDLWPQEEPPNEPPEQKRDQEPPLQQS